MSKTPFTAYLEIARAQQLAAAARPFKEPKLPAPSLKKRNDIVNPPVCGDCGTDEAVELITFTDKDTGELTRRFKCQACGKWLGKACSSSRTKGSVMSPPACQAHNTAPCPAY
ncbi:MAG: hypothetical protein ISS52_01560 [Dehalococcoidia bacterium]|nr:hypothetical protein [Dehalococcoidia bacterium]